MLRHSQTRDAAWGAPGEGTNQAILYSGYLKSRRLKIIDPKLSVQTVYPIP